MSELDSLLSEIKKTSLIKGVELFIDDTVDRSKKLFVIVSENGMVGATGFVEDNELVFLFLDNKKVKYLFDEGFEFEDFYKIMGDKLFYFVDRDTFFDKLLRK